MARLVCPSRRSDRARPNAAVSLRSADRTGTRPSICPSASLAEAAAPTTGRRWDRRPLMARGRGLRDSEAGVDMLAAAEVGPGPVEATAGDALKTWFCSAVSGVGSIWVKSPQDIDLCQYRRVTISAVLLSPTETVACCSPLSREPLSQPQAEQIAPLLKALADPVRLRLLSIVASHEGGEACVCDLTRVLRAVAAHDQPPPQGAAQRRPARAGEAGHVGLLPRPP